VLPAPPPTVDRERERDRGEVTNVIPFTSHRRASSRSFASSANLTAVREAPDPTIVMKNPFPMEEDEPVAPPVAEPAQPQVMTSAPVIRVKPRVEDQWAIYESLGLGPPKAQPQSAQKFFVNTYRGMGFAILTIIVVVLLGYIATSVFYFVSDSWIQPMVVSRTDERVLALEAQVAEQENLRDQIAADLAHADRYIAVQQAFQAQFVDAIRADLEGREAALERARELADRYEGARKRVKASNAAYASASRKKMAAEYEAGLIDRSDMLSGKYQLAQITTSNLGLAERQAEYEARAEELESEARALQAMLDESGGDTALSYEVLRIKQEYEMSRLETTKAIENREALRSSLARQEAIIESLRQSPFLRAIDDDADVAFVPYGNLDNVSVGTPVYGCALEMFWCEWVGRVKEVLPGEVTFKHPHREKILRGQMIELDLGDRDAAEDEVLFVGDKPLFL
jgi:hypothetical protein